MVLCAENQESFALLAAASHCGHVRIVRQLLLTTCNVDQQDKHGRSALWFASNEGHLPVVKLLTAVRSCSA